MTLDPTQTPDDFSQLFAVQFRAGDGSAILRAIALSAALGFESPTWAAAAISSVLSAASSGLIESWDDVFGRPYPKGTHRRGLRTQSARWAVWLAVRDAADAGQPIDDDLFDHVGRELGVGGKSTVKRLYSQVQQAVLRAQAELAVG